MSNFKIYNHSPPELNISYNKVIRPLVFSNSPGYLISQVDNIFVSYNFSFTTNTFALDAQVFLEISSDNNNWIILNQSGLITPSAPPVNIKINSLTGFIPKGNYVRLRGQADPNTTITYIDGTEYILN
jgi:hypothetical protein